jgi:hypothetical protein
LQSNWYTKKRNHCPERTLSRPSRLGEIANHENTKSEFKTLFQAKIFCFFSQDTIPDSRTIS